MWCWPNNVWLSDQTCRFHLLPSPNYMLERLIPRCMRCAMYPAIRWLRFVSCCVPRACLEVLWANACRRWVKNWMQHCVVWSMMVFSDSSYIYLNIHLSDVLHTYMHIYVDLCIHTLYVYIYMNIFHIQYTVCMHLCKREHAHTHSRIHTNIYKYKDV